MNLFVVGDVHGCYETFKKLLSFWNRDSELLIQVGDFIDRGNFNPQTIKLCRELENKHGAIFLKGNHEQMALEYVNKTPNERWYKKYGSTVLWQYVLEEADFEADARWLGNLNSVWENDSIFICHAGISNSLFCMDEKHIDGILWNRGEIKNIGKLQIYGHTPLKSGKPLFRAESNAWNIDTGAYRGKNLSALRLSEKGEVLEIISVPTVNKDID